MKRKQRREADLRLCFRICKTLVFSRRGSNELLCDKSIYFGFATREDSDQSVHPSLISLHRQLISSPEPKAHGELIVYQSSRRPCVRLCVNTFKHEYLSNQQADCNQILSEASLGWGKGCIRFPAGSDWNSGFHGNG